MYRDGVWEQTLVSVNSSVLPALPQCIMGSVAAQPHPGSEISSSSWILQMFLSELMVDLSKNVYCRWENECDFYFSSALSDLFSRSHWFLITSNTITHLPCHLYGQGRVRWRAGCEPVPFTSIFRMELPENLKIVFRSSEDLCRSLKGEFCRFNHQHLHPGYKDTGWTFYRLTHHELSWLWLTVTHRWPAAAVQVILTVLSVCRDRGSGGAAVWRSAGFGHIKSPLLNDENWKYIFHTCCM